MAGHHAIADVAAAVLRHLTQPRAGDPPVPPLALCLPAEMAGSDGLTFCLWQIVPAPRNSMPRPVADASKRDFRPSTAFDLRFVAASTASAVERQHEQLGWLLWALSSYPVVQDSTVDPPVSLTIDTPDPIADLGLRRALRLLVPTVGFTARSALL
jgi:hypothetical protein